MANASKFYVLNMYKDRIITSMDGSPDISAWASTGLRVCQSKHYIRQGLGRVRCEIITLLFLAAVSQLIELGTKAFRNIPLNVLFSRGILNLH